MHITMGGSNSVSQMYIFALQLTHHWGGEGDSNSKPYITRVVRIKKLCKKLFKTMPFEDEILKIAVHTTSVENAILYNYL